MICIWIFSHNCMFSKASHIILSKAKSSEGYKQASGALLRSFIKEYLISTFQWDGKGHISIEGNTLILSLNSSLSNELQIRKGELLEAIEKKFGHCPLQSIKIKTM